MPPWPPSRAPSPTPSRSRRPGSGRCSSASPTCRRSWRGCAGASRAEELRRALESYRAQVERAYAEFAGRGEDAWGRLREQPQVRQAITSLESYTGKRDTRVDDLVVDASAAAPDAVESAGTATAGVIEDAGEETATTRKVTRGGARAATPRRAGPRGGPASG
jgi:hypothetical protein